MNWLHDLPIRRKLTRVILVTCSAVLLLACVVLAIYELFDFRRALARDMTMLADVLAKNTRAALAFEDDAAAEETLSALQAEPYVIAAGLYTTGGDAFAVYVRTNSSPKLPARIEGDGHRFGQGRLTIFRPVILNDKRIGTICLQAGLEGIQQRLLLFGGIALLVLAGSLAVAFFLSSRLQQPISEPILKLTETARAIAERKDYSVRATGQGKDETGVLTGAFNLMLTGIEERETALRTANASLTSEIAERQRAEDRVQAQLARLELLNQLTRAIGERQDLQSIFQVVLANLEEHLPVDLACICLCDPAAGVLTVSSLGQRSQALSTDLEARIDIAANELACCIGGQLVYEPDISQSGLPLLQELALGGLRSLVMVPLLIEKSAFGVLIVGRRKAEDFSSGECEFLRQVGDHVALAAHQVKLHGALQQAYDDLRQTQQAVLQQERLSALGQMASGIAHDINNAISPIALYTESLLEKEPNLSTRTREYLTTIQRAAEDVAQTVSRMREFYRRREPQVSLAPVSLNRLVEQVVALTRARWHDMALQRGVVIALHQELAPDLPTVMGIESEIREALTNLIFNAVDAMPEGGKLTLRTRVVDKPVDAQGAAGQPQAWVEVVDSGVGMDEETRRRCLEPFFTTKGERGTGLGLAMVYGVVQRHGSEIEIDSAPGQGTTIRLIFTVPKAVVAEAAYAGTVPVVPSSLRLLLVDDDPLITKSLRQALESDGHEVTVAMGGQAGIDIFQASCRDGAPFAAVITDLGMPHVDGRKVAAAVKAASPGTPVLLFTGWGQRLVAEGDVPSHVDRVLNKPPKLRELREALAFCCRVAAK